MESERQTTGRETPPQNWRSCKLIIDPALTKGLYKVYRYDGQQFNIPVEDLPVGLFPVDTVRDPRICRMWSKCSKTDLLVAKFKVDEWYVGPVPPKEVTFSRLNDNVREAFLTNMCSKYGNIEDVEIFHNPKNKKHLGIAKVVFDTVKAAKDAVQQLHQTSVMGNIIHVEIDPKGENRARYVQLLLRGLYTPWTLPLGSDERPLQSLIDSLLGGAATQRHGSISSPISIATPLSLDTAYSSILQDTPCSFGLTPRSQGTPRTPCFSATPLSQDSCYSSLQATPVLQGEPSGYSVHKPLRRELCHRKPARCHRGSGEVSDVNLFLKHSHSLSTQLQASSQQLALWGLNAQSSTHNNTEPSFNATSSCEETRDVDAPASDALHLNSFSILSVNFTADQQTAASSPPDACITALSPSAVSRPQPQVESLDSRIESLLINSRNADPSYFDGETLEADAHSQDSPTSPCLPNASLLSEDSLVCTPPGLQHSFSDAPDVSPAWRSETEEDETTRAVSFLTRNSQSPTSSDFIQFEIRTHENNEKEMFQSLLCPKENHEERSTNRPSGALTPKTEVSFLPQPPPFTSLCSATTSQTPPAIRPPCPHPPVAPFPFPIPPFPPSLPPVPPRLPNGTIPIPPPGWIPPPGIPIPPPRIPPPPSIPPPPAFLGPPPPLLVPPTVPPPGYSSPIRHAGSSHKACAPLPFPRPPWPAPPFPRFNPFVPPPDFPLLRANPHKITVEKVIEAILDELKLMIKKDITRRMIEGIAFRTFEDWWDCQEKKPKIQVPPLKSGATSAEERCKLTNPLSRISGSGKKPPLPSFKVKRKRPNDPSASEEIENTVSTHETCDVKQGDDSLRSERPKRRHARPHELDSDDGHDDEGKEEYNAQRHEATSDKVEAFVRGDPQILCNRDDDDGHHEEEQALTEKHNEDEDAVVFQTHEEVQRSDSETFSESSSSEESDYSSDFDSSDSFSSESFEDSPFSDLSPEDEDMDEEEEDGRSDECIVISSDEESMELEPAVTPPAPLTPGTQLELVQDWSAPFHREENQLTSCQQDTCDLEVIMELQSSEPQDDLRLLSPIGLPDVEPHLDVDMESPEWTVESQENIEILRPLTPTGCLVDSDPELLMRSKPTSPAVEEVERPQTPGKGIVVELETEDSADEVLPLSLTSAELAVAHPSVYQDMPKTPGREDRGRWTRCGSGRAPATPGRETAASENSVIFPNLCSPPAVPCLSRNPYITAPKTPGRDIILPRRSIVHRRKLHLCDSIRSPPVSPCSLSDSSPDPADGRCAWISSGVRAKPLQGLENMPGLLGEESRRETEKSFLRRKRLRQLKRRWRIHQRSLKRIAVSPRSRPRRRRSLCEERWILHRVWRDGLDEEDARLLHCTYDRLQEQDSGFGWISDTMWTHHPLTKVLTGRSDEHTSWQPHHRTGSARSEGFYKISRKDKLKYLINTRLNTELPSTSAQQGTCIPAQQQTSLRSGSDFRSEQRRLLSSFSCDSDLVKFNQLKFRRKKIRFSRSHIHEWGLFAMEPIAADEMVIEYVGQIIRQVLSADADEELFSPGDQSILARVSLCLADDSTWMKERHLQLTELLVIPARLVHTPADDPESRMMIQNNIKFKTLTVSYKTATKTAPSYLSSLIQVIADMREHRYEEEGIGSSYLFRIDQDTIIDATKCGNLSRFINHSCNPNCYAKIITVESQKKIVIYSRQPISIDEEITYDYKFPIEETKIPCLCGADGCRGSLN